MQRSVTVIDCKRAFVRNGTKSIFPREDVQDSLGTHGPAQNRILPVIGLATGVISNVGQSGKQDSRW